MQSYSKLLGLLFLSTAALASCKKEGVPEQPAPEQTVTVSFSASLAEDDLTKTYLNGSSLKWSLNDTLKVRQVYYKSNVMNCELANSGKPVADGSNYKLSAKFAAADGTPDAHFTGGYKYMYQGFFPGALTEASSNGSVKVTLPFFQTVPSQDTFDPRADVLYSDAVYAKSQRSASQGKTINGMTFHRLSAIGSITVSGKPSSISSSAKVEYVEFSSASNEALAGTYSFSVSNPNTGGTPTNTSKVIRIDMTNVEADPGNFKVYFTCLPVSLSGYKVKVITDKGSYERSFTTSKTFTAGSITSISASMGSATVSTSYKTVKLMTYNVAALRTYGQYNLKQDIYVDNGHYWKPKGASDYVRYTRNDFTRRDSSVQHNHIANVIAEQLESNVPMLVGFNELDCNKMRTLKATANVRKKKNDDHTDPITATRTVFHGYQLNKIKTSLEANHGSWWFYFAPAITYSGSLPSGYSVPDGEPKLMYGNGVISNKKVKKDAAGHYMYSRLPLNVKQTYPSEEERVVAVLETDDCVFASVHMGGVSDGNRTAVIRDQIQIMNEWFMTNYKNYSKPVFICGDFNAYPEEIDDLMYSHWKLLSVTNEATHSTNCLDYIFCFKYAKPAYTTESHVVKTATNSSAPYGISALSDHLPIVATVRIPQ